MVQLGPLLQGIGGESEYRNDEMIDNQLRSVLFQVPVSGNPACLDGPGLPQCFDGVADLGAIDLQRGRDHGMPTYNQMRNAYGLSSKTSFTAITGESTDAFPTGLGIDSPSCLDITAAFDIKGNPTTVDADNAVRVVRRCTLAARLKAIYGTPSNMDAFTGKQHQGTWGRLMHAGKQIGRSDDVGKSGVQDTLDPCHGWPQARVEIPEPFQNRGNVFNRQRDHRVDRHANGDFRQW